jgi:hypothetical protein
MTIGKNSYETFFKENRKMAHNKSTKTLVIRAITICCPADFLYKLSLARMEHKRYPGRKRKIIMEEKSLK